MGRSQMPPLSLWLKGFRNGTQRQVCTNILSPQFIHSSLRSRSGEIMWLINPSIPVCSRKGQIGILMILLRDSRGRRVKVSGGGEGWGTAVSLHGAAQGRPAPLARPYRGPGRSAVARRSGVASRQRYR